MRGANLTIGLILGSLLAVGCGGPTLSPAPSRSPAPATVPLTIDIRLPGDEFLRRDVHAAVADASGRVATWRVEDGRPRLVPAGELVLDVWSVAFSDVVVCPSNATDVGSDCYQPTMGPHATCSVTVRLVSGQAARFRYHVLPQGRCRLGPRNGG